MKCDNCGKEEVNFHYTSDINGSITEKNLCAECAEKLGIANLNGLGDKSEINQEMTLEDIFADMFVNGMPRRMAGNYGVVLPTFFFPAIGMLIQMPETGETLEQPEPKTEIKVEIDSEMQKRREVNVLREQMRKACEAEDFEKAAELRDTIKKIDGANNT